MRLRKRRLPRRGRIEIIPMIDVMFFLLATFMLASLVMQNLNSLPVNLPKGKAERSSISNLVTLTISRTAGISINRIPVTLGTLANVLKPLLRNPSQPVIVSADKAAPDGVVVQAMLRARAAGVQHFLIVVRRE
ncbi:MAG: biopolymer transporter ExbD [Gammaproteobacteria bacterium]|nr:biopolymer transporter ExbD [Gammaproteobacteria bacterium]